jgi:hypothetical protein
MQIAFTPLEPAENLLMLRDLIDVLIARHNNVQVDEKPKDEKPKDEKPKDEKPKDEKPKDEKPARSSRKPPVVKTVTVEEVRAVMVRLAAKHRDEMVEILAQFGADKLSQVDPAKLPEILERVSALETVQ